MTSFFWKTFGGLAPAYYFRHFVFGLMFPAFVYLGVMDQPETPRWHFYGYVLVSTLLYPYSRFIYERVVEFVLGSNVFYLNGWIFLFWKLATMAVCWALAMAIAPIGLLYLYIHYSHEERKADK